MGKTKNCFIVSESTGYTLNVDHDTNALEITNRSKDLWTKHNWLIEQVVLDESNYDNDFIEGTKSQSGQLRHVCESGKAIYPIIDGFIFFVDKEFIIFKDFCIQSFY
jgi:hypothetical protein